MPGTNKRYPCVGMAQICRSYEKKHRLTIGSLKERTLRGFDDTTPSYHLVNLCGHIFNLICVCCPVTSNQDMNQWSLCAVEAKRLSCQNGQKSTCSSSCWPVATGETGMRAITKQGWPLDSTLKARVMKLSSDPSIPHHGTNRNRLQFQVNDKTYICVHIYIW